MAPKKGPAKRKVGPPRIDAKPPTIKRRVVKGVEAAKKTGNRDAIAHELAHSLAKPTQKAPNAPGKLHSIYRQEALKINDSTANSYRAKLRGMKVSAIRASGRILRAKTGNESAKDRVLGLRDEQTRRIRTYTDQIGEKTFRLAYSKVASSHNLLIGLGEVFVNANMLRVKSKEDGSITIVKRMVTPSGRHKGRLAFCTAQPPHTYFATFDGDEVTILDNNYRVSVNNATSLAAHVKVLDQEEAARKRHSEYYRTNEEAYSSRSSYTPPLNDFKKGGKIDLNVKVPQGKGIMAQMHPNWLKKLSATQRRSILIIEDEFKRAGLTNPNLIAAAIVNAYKESSLRPSIQSCCRVKSRGWNERGFYDKKGKLREDSWGLFQMNAPASVSMKRGMTEAQRAVIRERRAQFRADMRNPRKNCQKVIRRIKSWRGKQLLAAANAGMGVPELARLFTIHIEICANRYEVGKQRGRFALRMFKHTLRPEPKIKKDPNEEIASRGGVITGKFSGPPWGKRRPVRRWRPNGRISIRPGQKKWVIGSSTISGSCSPYLKGRADREVGHIGIGAYHAGRMLKFLREKSRAETGHWKDLFNQAPPSTIVLAGFALNDIGKSAGSDAAVVNKSIKRHKALKRFFEAWGKARGVKVKVLVATNQEHTGKGPIAQRRIAMFNQRLRNEGLTHHSVDLAKKMKQNGWKTSSADNLHLSGTAARGFVNMLTRA